MSNQPKRYREREFHPNAFVRSLSGAGVTDSEFRIAAVMAQHARKGRPVVIGRWGPRLAEHCEMSERTVRRCLAGLTSKGIIRPVGAHAGGETLTKWELIDHGIRDRADGGGPMWHATGLDVIYPEDSTVPNGDSTVTNGAIHRDKSCHPPCQNLSSTVTPVTPLVGTDESVNDESVPPSQARSHARETPPPGGAPSRGGGSLKQTEVEAEVEAAERRELLAKLARERMERLNREDGERLRIQREQAQREQDEINRQHEERKRAQREREERERLEREQAERERLEREQHEQAQREQAITDCHICNDNGHIQWDGDLMVLPLKPTPELLRGGKISNLTGARQCSKKLSDWTTVHFVTDLVCRHDYMDNFLQIERFGNLCEDQVSAREYLERCDAMAAEDAAEAAEYEQERKTCTQCDRYGDRTWIRDDDTSFLVVVFTAGRAPDKHHHLVADGAIELHTMPVGNPDNPTLVVQYCQIKCDHNAERNQDAINGLVRDHGGVAVTTLTKLGAMGYGARGAITGGTGQSQLAVGLIPAAAAITTGDDTVVAGDDTVVAEIVDDDQQVFDEPF